MKDIKKWTVNKSEYIWSDEPWLTVVKDSVQLANGTKIENYYTFEYPDWINVIARREDGKFVFVRQYRHGIKQVNYELCAGVCDDTDHSPLQSAQRELLEETGYGQGTWSKIMELSPNPGTHCNTVHCFLATDVVKVSEQNLEDTEDIDVHVFTLDQVRQLLMDGEIKQAVMAAPLWRYLAEIK